MTQINSPTYSKREWVSISELKAFARCPRKYFHQVGCGLQERSGRIAMDFGTAIHEAVVEAELNGPQAGLTAFAKKWAEWPEHEASGDDKRNLRNAAMILHAFHAASGPWEVVKPPHPFESDDISPYEVGFIEPLDGLEIPIVGRMDGLVRSRTTGQLWVREYKTTSQMGQSFLQAFNYNSQVIGYCWAARQGLTGKLREMGLLGPTDQIQGTVVVGLGVNKASWPIMHIPVSVTQSMEDSWKGWALDVGQRILACERSGSWPQYVSGCNGICMFGVPSFRNCEFEKLCQAGENWQALTGLYNYEPHLPLKVLKEVAK